MATRKPSKKLKRRLTPRVKVWLELDGDYVFGHGIAEILQAVDATGSLKEAATKIGKSYRHVWSRVKEAEEALHRGLVETHVGGQGTKRSFLTDDARQLLSGFVALRERMLDVVASEFAERFHAT